MSELPRTDELNVEADRVEEAFGVFTERVRELESVADALRAELRALRAERAAAPAFGDEEEVWPIESGPAGTPSGPSPDWVAAVPPPLTRSSAAPRLVLESAFLVFVALLAGLADLSAPWIVLVMGVAWVLVALSEWTVAARSARWRLGEIAPPVGDGAAETTGPWDMPVVQATVVEAPDESESRTVIAKLPEEPQDTGEPEEALEPEATPPRGLRFWRRRSVEPTPDPWEA